MSPEASRQRLLDVRELRKHYPVRKGLLKKVVGQVRNFSRDVHLGLNRSSRASETKLNRRGMVDLGGIQPETGRLRSF